MPVGNGSCPHVIILFQQGREELLYFKQGVDRLNGMVRRGGRSHIRGRGGDEQRAGVGITLYVSRHIHVVVSGIVGGHCSDSSDSSGSSSGTCKHMGVGDM
jgi:hypothetical protein